MGDVEVDVVFQDSLWFLKVPTKIIISFIATELRTYVCLDQLPAAPVNSDITLLTTATGSFLLDVRNTQPTNANLSSSVHSFVVRMDGDNITKYWWMVSSYITLFILYLGFLCMINARVN